MTDHQKVAFVKSRKRKLEDKVEQYGIDLPEIPGLPVTVVAVHVHALKQTLVSIEKDYCDHVLVPGEDDVENSREEGFCSGGGSVQSLKSKDGLMASLVERFEHATSAPTRGVNEERACRKRLQDRQGTVQAWLSAIHREVRDSKKGSVSKIPVAAMNHLWEMAIQDRSIAVRRAALFLSGHLLKKSSVARRWLFDGDSKFLVEWLDVLLDPPKADRSSTDVSKLISLWQREAYLWIESFFQTQQFRQLYPRITVAVQRIQQQCPAVMHQSNRFSLDNNPEDHESLLTQNMETWRSLRDIAMDHFEQEEKYAKRILQRCINCFDLLVPRVEDEAQQTTSNPVSVSQNDGDSDDEDGDIDWEDGFEEKGKNLMGDQNYHVHEEAVERTLLAMQATAKGLEDGQLEIDMNSTSAVLNATSAVLNSENKTASDHDPGQIARNRLEKCITRLRKCHLPRLSKWIDGLTKADSLIKVTSSSNGLGSAWIQPADDRDIFLRRSKALQTLIELKSVIANTLSSAARLLSQPPQQQNVSERLKTSNLDRGTTRPIDSKAGFQGQRKGGRVQIKYKNIKIGNSGPSRK